MFGPGDDGVDLDCCAEYCGEFVVACGDASPLLQVAEAAFDDVAAFIALGIECRGSSPA